MTKQEFDAETVVECPTCESAGHLDEYSQYESAGGKPAGYQVFGIGKAYTDLESFMESCDPQTIEAMIGLLKEARTLINRCSCGGAVDEDCDSCVWRLKFDEFNKVVPSYE